MPRGKAAFFSRTWNPVKRKTGKGTRRAIVFEEASTTSEMTAFDGEYEDKYLNDDVRSDITMSEFGDDESLSDSDDSFVSVDFDLDEVASLPSLSDKMDSSTRWSDASNVESGIKAPRRVCSPVKGSKRVGVSFEARPEDEGPPSNSVFDATPSEDSSGPKLPVRQGSLSSSMDVALVTPESKRSTLSTTRFLPGPVSPTCASGLKCPVRRQSSDALCDLDSENQDVATATTAMSSQALPMLHP